MSSIGRGVVVGLTVGTLTLVSLFVYWRQRKLKRLAAIEKELKGRNYDKKKALASAEARPNAESKEAANAPISSSANPLQERRVDSQITVSKNDVYALRLNGLQAIKKIQRDTNTRIMQIGDCQENGDRTYSITGLPVDVEMAENQIKRHILSQPVQTTSELTVPDRMLGRIIGRGGEIIKGIQDATGARVDIPRTPLEPSQDFSESVENHADAGEPLRVIKVRGTDQQIQSAYKLIQDIIDEDVSRRNRIKRTAAARTPRVAPKADKTNHNPEAEVPIEHNVASLSLASDKMEVYVTCAYHPNSFWVQVFNKDFGELDKLIDQMTNYYTHNPTRDNESFTVGDMVAAYFDADNKWHRGRVLDVSDSNVEVVYVDYGDKRTLAVEDVRRIQPQFLRLRFQAIELTLNLDCPDPDGTWSEEAISAFCDLTRVGQWDRVLRANVIRYFQDNLIWVELHFNSLSIGEELVRLGFADQAAAVTANGESESSTSASTNPNNNADPESSVTYATVASSH